MGLIFDDRNNVALLQGIADIGLFPRLISGYGVVFDVRPSPLQLSIYRVM